MPQLRIRNWKKHQHYAYRKPPWIKLYRELLDDVEWHKLSGESAKGLIMLWLIASEEEGYLPDSVTLAFRLRISENRVIALLSDCSHWFEGDASNMLAECKQDAIPETETETETEKRKASPTVILLGSNEFLAFWESYPRKVDRKEAHRVWVKGRFDGQLGEILAGLESWKLAEQWFDVEKIPYPSTWLNKQRWREAPIRVAKITKASKTDEAINRYQQKSDFGMAIASKQTLQH